MKGYKIPKGFVEGYRNAIEQYPKDSQYAWGMNAVVEALEVHPLEELDENPWHTGTPTEGGLYFVYDKYAGYGKRELPEDIEAKDLELVFTHIVAWQKITPYEEN